MVGNIRRVRWPIAVLVALIAMTLGWGSALAAPGDTAKAAPGDKAKAALERGYVRAQKGLRQQDEHLTRMATFADKVAAAIANAKAKGKDTAAVEAALATFRQKLSAARADWQTASATLASHAGFDDQGKVTDVDAARATLTSARESMLKAHKTMEGAAKELRAALKAFRKANRDAPQTPEVPPAPPEPAP